MLTGSAADGVNGAAEATTCVAEAAGSVEDNDYINDEVITRHQVEAAEAAEATEAATASGLSSGDHAAAEAAGSVEGHDYINDEAFKRHQARIAGPVAESAGRAGGRRPVDPELCGIGV